MAAAERLARAQEEPPPGIDPEQPDTDIDNVEELDEYRPDLMRRFGRVGGVLKRLRPKNRKK